MSGAIEDDARSARRAKRTKRTREQKRREVEEAENEKRAESFPSSGRKTGNVSFGLLPGGRKRVPVTDAF
jgi:hypothetical protein